jgi:hypothetical protein
LLTTAHAETYNLTDGTSVTGDVISFNDDGVIFREGDDKYSDRILWTKFSQDALKLLAKNKKLKAYAEPFIEVPPKRPAQLDVKVHDVSRLELPPKQSVIGALGSSFIGIIFLLAVYAANILAAYEIAIFRAQPIGIVMGMSAVVPFIVPIVYLCMPTKVEGGATQEDMQMETGAPPGAAAAPHHGHAAASAAPIAMHGAPTAEGDATPGAEPVQVASKPSHPETQVFQRGQFTFNRRFFETKFAGFFGAIRHGSSKDMVLVIKAGRAQHIAERITRISANEAHFEVVVGAARQEVAVPFGDIQEIQLKHKDA